MPAPICFAHQLVERQAEVRKSGLLPWLRPDAKSQVTCRYENGKVAGLDAVVLSTQHNPDVKLQGPARSRDGAHRSSTCCRRSGSRHDTKFHINPTGNFVIGGPVGDCGLTGRKIIVDSYGGMARHGGGAFSGKDPSKVDRSAAYAARYVAKNIVAAGLADRCEIQVSYAIGVAEPTSITVDTFGTGKVAEDTLEQLVREHFDLRPYGIIKMLDLVHPMYRATAAYGHFGREPGAHDLQVEGIHRRQEGREERDLHGLHLGDAPTRPRRCARTPAYVSADAAGASGAGPSPGFETRPPSSGRIRRSPEERCNGRTCPPGSGVWVYPNGAR